jgi:hypothetical protein
MIECTSYSEPEYPGQWMPGIILTDDRDTYSTDTPYAKLLRHPAKLDHERPWRCLVACGGHSTRAHFRTARRAFRWASGLLRATITGGRYGIYGKG